MSVENEIAEIAAINNRARVNVHVGLTGVDLMVVGLFKVICNH